MPGMIETDDDDLKVCRGCKQRMADNQPRGFVIDEGVMYVLCISCTEGDTESIKLGSPMNPIEFSGEQ